jgi:hypothetical protein
VGEREPIPRAQIKPAHSGKPMPDTLQILRPSTVEPNVTLEVWVWRCTKRDGDATQVKETSQSGQRVTHTQPSTVE